jgi:hypothetical protein
MSSQSPADDGAGAAALLVAAMVIVAIIGLILLARGPESQDHSALPHLVAAIAARA